MLRRVNCFDEEKTRMHSSRMRTARLLPVSPSMNCSGVCTWSGGVYVVRGVYLVPGDVPGPGGCTWSQGDVPGSRGDGGVPGLGVYLGVPGLGVYLVPEGCTVGVYLVLEGYLLRYSPHCEQNDKQV